MIGRLKRRFVAMTMMIFVMILVMIIGGIYALLVVNGSRAARDVLIQTAQMDGRHPESKPPPGFADDDDDDGPPKGRREYWIIDRNDWVHDVFSARVDHNGALMDTHSDFRGNGEDIEAVLALAMETGADDGSLRYGGFTFAFLREERDYGAVYVFLDMGSIADTLRGFLRVAIYTGIGCLAAVFAMSLILAEWSVRPIARAWRRQKEFIADASHELKTPLTAILANLDVAVADPRSTVGEQVCWLDNIRSEARRMSGLVSDLLFLARSDQVSLPADIAPFSLSSAVERAVLPLESVAFEAGKTLETEIAPDIAMTGNEAQIVQLTVILLDNAIKHSDPDGSITLTLAADRDRAVLTVSNTGPAIPPENLPYIFRRFYRVDPSRNRETGGHGLGLSIVRRIVDLHRGQIEVTSRDMTTFAVTLPLAGPGSCRSRRRDAGEDL